MILINKNDIYFEYSLILYIDLSSFIASGGSIHRVWYVPKLLSYTIYIATRLYISKNQKILTDSMSLPNLVNNSKFVELKRTTVLGEIDQVWETVEFMKCFSVRNYIYKDPTIILDPATDTSIKVHTLTFFQWYIKRYGFGHNLVLMLLKMLGFNSISPTIRLHQFPRVYFPEHDDIIEFFSDVRSRLDMNCAQFMYNRQRSIIESNSRKGLRMRAGLPCNGQRTRTNAATARKFPYYFSIHEQLVLTDILPYRGRGPEWQF